MDNAAQVPRGRTSSILLLSLLTFGTIVITTAPFLSQNVKYKISFITVYIWETVLLVSALIAMVLIILLRKNKHHMKLGTQSDTSRKQYVTPCLIVIFGVSASILPFYECKQVSTCLEVTIKQQHKLQFVTYLCVGIYTIFQSMFGFVSFNYRCQSFLTRILTVVIISANASLFCNCVWNTIRSLNTQSSQDPFRSDKNMSRDYYFKHTFVYSWCENGTEYIDNSTTTWQVYKHTYPLLLEYLLFSVTLLVPLWNIVIHRQIQPDNIQVNVDTSTTSIDQTEQVQNQTETQPLLLSGSFHFNTLNYTCKEKLVYSLKGAIHFVSQYSIIFSSVFAVTVLVLHGMVEINYQQHTTDIPKKKLSFYEVAYYNLETVYIYIISSVPFIGYFIARQKQSLTIWRNAVDTALLLVGGVVLLVLIIFQTVDSIAVLNNHQKRHLTEDVMFFIKLFFYYAGTYFQIKLLLKAMCLPVGSGSSQGYKVHIKGIIIFLGFCNVERWLADSFMPPTELKYADDIQSDDTFGHVTWWILVQVLFPFVMFYRIWSALMCYKAYSMIQ